jgi:ADP-heptose:LPS heptosyltransferase
MKFLIIRFSSIGDIVLTTPVIRCLKKQVVTAEIHYCTKKSFLPILKANPYVDKIHCLDNDLDTLIETLKAEDFDYIIDLHHNLRTLKVKRALKKQSFSFDKLNIKKWLLTNFRINKLPNVHIVDRYLDTLKTFNIKNDGAGLDYFIPNEDQLKPEDIPTSHQAGYVGLVIGAALATKRLPYHKLETICKQTTHPLILLGGPEDAETAKKLAAIDPIKIYNACGLFNLNESAGLVKQAKLILTHDTGLMHIAAAFKRPIISIWGNTVPEFGMAPYYGENFANNYRGGLLGQTTDLKFEVKGLSCRPCSKIGYNKCPKGHFKCMEQQPIDSIFQYF